MNKKGFTLVELLAVIVILSLLTLLTATSVTKLVKDSKEDLYNNQIQLIKSAAEIWGADNLMKLPDTGKCSYLTLLDLKEYGLIDSNILDPNNSQAIEDNLKVKITTESSSYGNIIYNYEVNPASIDGCTEIYDTVCTAVSTATAGNIPTGEFLPGDEYTCKVKKATETESEASYTFFVLSTEGNKVNLILNKNICEDGTFENASKECYVPWISKEDYERTNIDETECGKESCVDEGPITAINYLNRATSSWNNIENLNEKYDDENGYYKGFLLNGKARMPYKKEVDSSNSTTMPFLYTYMNINEINGYWTLYSYNNQFENQTSFVQKIGSVENIDPYFNAVGVRPVITVSKYRIQNEILEES